jgi:dihydrofolate reductase
MRTLKLEMQVSADGFAADAQAGTDWMVWNWAPQWRWDEPLRQYHNALTTASDCILLSRMMAEEGFHSHWEEVARNSPDPQCAFADPITQMRKIVFSRTLAESRWPRTELARGSLPEVVNALKREPGKDILVYGGPTFASALLDAELIDELHLFINPAVLGRGRPMFKGLQRHQSLRLQAATAFDCGVAVLRYAR